MTINIICWAWRTAAGVLCCAALAVAAPRAWAAESAARTATAAGPKLDLPDDQNPKTTLPRETPIENALGRAEAMSGSAFGGYGEITLNAKEGQTAVVDVRRLVLFFGHNFSSKLRFYSEVEIEHAIASSADKGEVEVEQAYLDALLDKRLALRGGLIIMPVGIVNVYHEPPSFNGVDRPDVDQLVIPSTWREAGVGVFGEIAEGLRYQAYLVDGFDSNRFTAESAIREGHQEAQLASAGDFGGVARLDYEPALGTVFGLSGYYATSGNTLTAMVGKVPVGIVEVDARTRAGGFTARAEFAFLSIGDTAALNRALDAAIPMGGTSAGPVSARSFGAYIEAGYDLFRLLDDCDQHLTLFGRWDYADTQAGVPDGFTARPELRRNKLTAGLTYRPILEIALKLDYRRELFGDGTALNEVATAITWMF